MSERFKYVKYTPESVSKQEAFKSMFEAIEAYAIQVLPDSRATSLLLTALEEAYMWTGKAIRDKQIIDFSNSPNSPSGLCGSDEVRGLKQEIRHIQQRG